LAAIRWYAGKTADRTSPPASTTSSISVLMRHLHSPHGITKLLGLDTRDRLLSLFDECVQLGSAPDVELPKMLDEFTQVPDGGIPKHLGLTVA
jgi:hypothetical protein